MIILFGFQMMLKNLTNNAKNLAANAKIEDMTQLFKSTVGKQDVKHALSGVMDMSKEVSRTISQLKRDKKCWFKDNFYR